MILNEHIDRINAIQSLKPDAKFSWLGDVITWLDAEQTEPTTSEIDAEVIRLQAEYDAQSYARSRKVEYPTIEECVHAILDDDLTALQVKRQAVKDKYPKS
jgi:hypothetical protein